MRSNDGQLTFSQDSLHLVMLNVSTANSVSVGPPNDKYWVSYNISFALLHFALCINDIYNLGYISPLGEMFSLTLCENSSNSSFVNLASAPCLKYFCTNIQHVSCLMDYFNVSVQLTFLHGLSFKQHSDLSFPHFACVRQPPVVKNSIATRWWRHPRCLDPASEAAVGQLARRTHARTHTLTRRCSHSLSHGSRVSLLAMQAGCQPPLSQSGRPAVRPDTIRPL